MVSNAIFFDTVEDLEQITSLPENKLWENGFNLDDMDFGFVSEDKWDYDAWYENTNNDGCFMHYILGWMEGHCVGYNEVFYCGKWYYTLHHS